jgi:hypothetical protein
VVVIAPSNEVLFYALGISISEETEDRWEPKGRQAFEAVVDSITFFKPFRIIVTPFVP